MTYRAQADRIAARAEAALARLLDSYRSGRITRDEFQRLAVDIVEAHNRVAARTADIALAADLTRAGQPAAPTGVTPDDRGRLTKAFDTVLAKIDAGDVAAAATVVALGRWEVLGAAQDTYSEAMRRQGVEKWTRGISPTACKICRDLSGTTLPVSVSMYHHPGCGCTQQPVVS